VVLLLAVLLAVSNFSGGSSTAKPSLRLMAGQPFAVRGQGFEPAEQVRVFALGSVRRASVRTRASGTGTFKAAFSRRDLGGCSLLVVTAVGSDGSRATLRPGRRPCTPPRIPPPRQ
jgi:hypothetical protein